MVLWHGDLVLKCPQRQLLGSHPGTLANNITSSLHWTITSHPGCRPITVSVENENISQRKRHVSSEAATCWGLFVGSARWTISLFTFSSLVRCVSEDPAKCHVLAPLGSTKTYQGVGKLPAENSSWQWRNWTISLVNSRLSSQLTSLKGQGPRQTIYTDCLQVVQFNNHSHWYVFTSIMVI